MVSFLGHFCPSWVWFQWLLIHTSLLSNVWSKPCSLLSGAHDDSFIIFFFSWFHSLVFLHCLTPSSPLVWPPLVVAIIPFHSPGLLAWLPAPRSRGPMSLVHKTACEVLLECSSQEGQNLCSHFLGPKATFPQKVPLFFVPFPFLGSEAYSRC